MDTPGVQLALRNSLDYTSATSSVFLRILRVSRDGHLPFCRRGEHSSVCVGSTSRRAAKPAMPFGDLLALAGGLGRFQVLNVALLCFPMLLMAAHNLLQNFTAAVPGHHCRVALNKGCADGNATGNPDCRALLRAFIPQNGDWGPEKCWRFVNPQWRLLAFNSTGWEPTEAEQEPCLDGWTYEGTVFTSTIVTEVGITFTYRSGGGLLGSFWMGLHLPSFPGGVLSTVEHRIEGWKGDLRGLLFHPSAPGRKPYTLVCLVVQYILKTLSSRKTGRPQLTTTITPNISTDKQDSR